MKIDLKPRSIVYYVLTALLVLPMLGTAYADLSASPQMVAGMTHLGYPLYLLKILGTAKLLGVIAIVGGFSPTLKEWAYAGFVFDFIGAFASHLFSGDPIGVAIFPAIFLAIALASYASWRKVRA